MVTFDVWGWFKWMTPFIVLTLLFGNAGAILSAYGYGVFIVGGILYHIIVAMFDKVALRPRQKTATEIRIEQEKAAALDAHLATLTPDMIYNNIIRAHNARTGTTIPLREIV